MRKASSYRWGAALLLLVVVGCGPDAQQHTTAAVRRPLYFDVKGTLESQVQRLNQQHAAAMKAVSLRGSATETVRVEHLNWTDELAIFGQADINKAALRGAYAVDSSQLASGLTRRSYTCRPGQKNAPVTQLVVLSEGTDLREIRADIAQHNSLFAARKQLRLFFQAGKLQRYEAAGTQKLLLFDTLRYHTAARVL